jgi:hypothetical protein
VVSRPETYLFGGISLHDLRFDTPGFISLFLDELLEVVSRLMASDVPLDRVQRPLRRRPWLKNSHERERGFHSLCDSNRMGNDFPCVRRRVYTGHDMAKCRPGVADSVGALHPLIFAMKREC